MSESPVVLTSIDEGEFRPLPQTFRQGGFVLEQMKREHDVAIYAKSKFPSHVWYEVIIIRGKQAYTIGENFCEAAEVYPSADQWGRYGFTYPNYPEAYHKFKNLLRARK